MVTKLGINHVRLRKASYYITAAARAVLVDFSTAGLLEQLQPGGRPLGLLGQQHQGHQAQPHRLSLPASRRESTGVYNHVRYYRSALFALFLLSLSNVLLTNTMLLLNEAPFYSIVVDGSMDISTEGHVLVYVRYFDHHNFDCQAVCLPP